MNTAEELTLASGLSEQPHRRLNILTGDWVLVSPHRTQRPWQGQEENISAKQRPPYDPHCYLCPGNDRAGDAKNPNYEGTFAFDNDFAALVPGGPSEKFEQAGLLQAQSESGKCRVVCFSPRHDLTLAEMSLGQLRQVVDLWDHEYRELAAVDSINYVQIFENKGSVMGCSNPHPHGQIWAQSSIPCEPARELRSMKDYYEKNGRPLLIDYVQLELEQEERVVCINESFVAVVPFWATWPFELMVLPRQQISSFDGMSETDKNDLADIISQLTIKYDNLFQISFPYTSGIHQAPTDGGRYPECTFHMHFYPPLLRSATVKKFMVGYEMLAGPQRDITPETSAEFLRKLPKVHYKHSSASSVIEQANP